jgi:hypothetical protein
MHGRSCTCLLAISVLMLTPAVLRGQSARSNPASDFPVPVRPSLPPDLLPGLPPGLPPNPVLPSAPVPLWPHGPRTPPGSPPGSSPGTIGFPLLVRASGAIFSGTVTAVAPQPANSGQAMEMVAITFHVENAIRGATAGDDLKISQWIGLWSGGQRYRVGERVLLFLYPPSKLGLTSSVGGTMGRFAVDPWGSVLLSPQHVSAFRADPVLGGKSHVSFSDFALAVRRASKEE